MKSNIIGIDLGATVGRVILAQVGGGSFSYEEVYHFIYEKDITKLYCDIFAGLMIVGNMKIKVDSIGVTASGNDYVCVEENGKINPYFNVKSSKKTKHILFIPDAVSYLLSGKMVCEYSSLKASGISSKLFPETVMPGTVIGTLRKEIGTECGLGPVKIVAVAGYDTASAIAAIPADDENFAYLKSGMPSTIGIETLSPIISPESSDDNFINEVGLNGANYFLRKITGGSILERCIKEWDLIGKRYTNESISSLMSKTRECITLIDVDDPVFVNPQSMLIAIEQYCFDNRLSIPNTDAMVLRCIIDSFTNKYVHILKKLEDFSPFPINRLHAIGMRFESNFLCQQIANAFKMPIVTGPKDAVSIGNFMIQAKALNIVNSVWDIRDYVRNTIPTVVYLPE